MPPTAMTETQRTTLYNHLTDAIGQDAARTLMEQLPPSGWDQVATKDDVKASEERILRDLGTRETRLKGEILLAIAASESRQSARIEQTSTRIDDTNTRIDETNTRIDCTNTRIDETNRKLSELKDEVTTGFAGLHLVLAKHIRWIAAMLLGFAVSMAVPLTIALI